VTDMWSSGNPKLQVAWDATSLSSLQKCARRYEYEIIQGWRQPGAVDLEFGGMFAEEVETYKKARLNGDDKHAATLKALRLVLNRSWIVETSPSQQTLQAWGAKGTLYGAMGQSTGKPWGGEYITAWHCLGKVPYKNAKGNRAKCPYSLKGHWHPGDGPLLCGECGSDTETQVRWVPADKVKDRYGLIRLIVGYCDEQPEDINGLEGGLSPFKFPDGTPAVELSFAIPTPWKTPYGDTYLLAGHMDSIGALGQTDHFITDNKTTTKALNDQYWSQFSPNVQVDLYDLASSLIFPDLKVSGVAIEGAQILKGGARFATKPLYGSEARREEFWREIEWWLKQAEKYASDDFWPMNRTACFLCPFKEVCNKDPGSRQMYLEANFTRKHWNPLDER
jgi:hypothetical protein